MSSKALAIPSPVNLASLVERAKEYAADARASSTRKAYESDFRAFEQWCSAQGLVAMPAPPAAVAVYLTHLADSGRKVATIERALTGIVHAHRTRGVDWPRAHPAIANVMAGIRRRVGTAPAQKAPVVDELLAAMLATLDEDLRGLRDRALLTLGWSGAFRRSELVAIDHEHLRFDAAGVTIRIPRSKADQEGKGADVTLPRMRGDDTCPVGALELWLTRAKIRRGPVFRAITRHGTMEERLSPAGVRDILLRRAAQAKLTVHPTERLSPHGLRAGFITEAYLAGAPDEQVAQHSRHADLSSMRGYRRRARITADNPARLLDL